MEPERELFDLGFLTHIPTAQERAIIGELDDMDDWASSLKKIQGLLPELISREGADFIASDNEAEREVWGAINDPQDRERQMGRYAPKITIDGAESRRGQTGTATERQLAYLRTLGVRDQEALLACITKKEATELIQDVLKLREENGLPI